LIVRGKNLEISDIDKELGFRTSDDRIEKTAKVKVHVPYREGYKFSPNCILCGSKDAPNKFTVQSTFKSGEYVVAKKKTTMKFDGMRLCNACKKKVDLSTGEMVLLAVAVLLATIVFGAMLYLKVFFCVGCMAWVAIAAPIFFLGRLLVPERAEAAPADMEVRAEGSSSGVGAIRPVGIIFKFRSHRAADEFAALNGGERVE
jgi:hypothetical protein